MTPTRNTTPPPDTWTVDLKDGDIRRLSWAIAERFLGADDGSIRRDQIEVAIQDALRNPGAKPDAGAALAGATWRIAEVILDDARVLGFSTGRRTFLERLAFAAEIYRDFTEKLTFIAGEVRP